MTNEDNKKQSPGEFTMDFSAFILSLNASSLIHMGEIPDPHLRERHVDISAAKHTIDILELLKEKTVGNLDEGEDKLLDDILYNLRLKYVQHTQGNK
jgi:hypothetical protein